MPPASSCLAFAAAVLPLLLWLVAAFSAFSIADPVSTAAGWQLQSSHGGNRGLHYLDANDDVGNPTICPRFQNQSLSRYPVGGTDLGYPFEYRDSLYLLFGETGGSISDGRDSSPSAATPIQTHVLN
jgi:hypothetical protein